MVPVNLHLTLQKLKTLLQITELLANLMYGVSESGGFPAYSHLIDSIDKYHAGNDIGQL